jgi:hypothetical protein
VGCSPRPAERNLAMILNQSVDDVNRFLLERSNDSHQRGTKPSTKPASVQTPAVQSTKIPPILILGFEGRALELYCSARLDVQFLNIPETVDGLLAEQYAESLLPKRHREQFFPGYLRHRFELEALTPSAIAERVAKSEAIQKLRASGQVFTASQLQRIICGGIE